MSGEYIGVDFDGTLAKSVDQYREGEVGAPIWRMVYRVQKWIESGKKVKIVSARADSPQDVAAIHYFLSQVGLPPLQVTNIKDHDMIALWDDRAVSVEKDTGVPTCPIPVESFTASLRLFSAEPATLFDGESYASIAIVFSGTRVALVGRDDEKKMMLPAGHVDPGESAIQCASRELREETGLDVPVDQFIFVGATIREHKQENNSFFATQIEGTPKLKAGSDVDTAFWQDVWNLPSLKFDPINALLKARQVLSTYPNDRGTLIAFEGVDGSGKSTQVRLLSEFLSKKGIAFTVSKWNSSELISDLIGELKGARKLSPQLFFLLHAADMMSRYDDEIMPALNRNEVVICDRYFYTGIVRDAVRGIDPKQNMQLYAKLRRPDVLFYCGIDPKAAVGRLDKDRLGHYNTGLDVGKFGEAKKESAVGYEQEMDRLYQDFLPDDSVTLDASCKPTTVARAVLDHIQDLILERYEIGDEVSETQPSPDLNGKVLTFTAEGRMRKIKKEAVLYAFNPETQYTCGQCFNREPGTNICSLFGPNDPISAKSGSCGFYAHEDTEKTGIFSPSVGVITKLQAGYAENKNGFSCKRCEYFRVGENDCDAVDKKSPGLTPGIIHPNACCNNWDADKTRAKMETEDLLRMISGTK